MTKPLYRPVRAVIVLALVLAASVGVSHPVGAQPARPSATVGSTNLGPNVYVFTPDMAQSDIQATVDRIAAQQLDNQFGEQRYALLFAPGTYGSTDDPLNFQVGYYTDVAGLGRNPADVVINGSINVYNQCDANGSCVALNNFWRSLSNLTINVAGNSGCYTNEFWATSQAASMRRVRVNGQATLMDYCTGPSFASGGFIADSSFAGQVINGSQQQYAVRNSNLDNGWSNSVWNQVFVGTQGAPAESFATEPNTYYTTIDQTPLEQEKPYLYENANGAMDVFVPSATRNTVGASWTSKRNTPGTSLPINRFFIATPSSTVAQINGALRAGQNLLLTPGVYSLSSAIRVVHPDTVVLGLGLPTLEPIAGNVAMDVAGLPGVQISDVIFDAGPRKSPTLLDMAPSRQPGGIDARRPSGVHDVYFRIGGAHAGRVDTAFTVGTSNVVLDNVWSWRADHGTGVGWKQNTATTGLKVTGANVIAYGLFVEHYQGDEILWNGPRGRIYMLQNEMPYDPPSQAAWNTSKTVLGHAALVVQKGGAGFRGYGMGSYSFFNQGVDIHATQAFTLAPSIYAHVHDVLTIFLDATNGSGGIDTVVNGQGGSSTAANADTPVTVTDY